MNGKGGIPPVDGLDSEKDPAAPQSDNRRRLLAWLVIVVVTGAVILLSVFQSDDDARDRAGSSAGPTTTTASQTLPPTTSPPPSADPSAGEPLVTPPTLAPVPLDQTAEFGDGISASLTALEAIDGQGQGIGEISGPAIQVTIRLDNGTGETFSLDAVTVNLYFGAEQIPAVELSDPAMDPFEGSVDPGQSAEGVYVFSVPLESRDLITLTVTDSPGSSTVVFSGPFS